MSNVVRCPTSSRLVTIGLSTKPQGPAAKHRAPFFGLSHSRPFRCITRKSCKYLFPSGFTQHSFKNAERGVVNVAYAQWMCLPMYVNNSLTSVPRCYTCTNPCLTRTHKCVYMFTLSLALLCAQLEHVNDEKELTFQNLLEHDKLSRRNFSRARIIR